MKVECGMLVEVVKDDGWRTVDVGLEAEVRDINGDEYELSGQRAISPYVSWRDFTPGEKARAEELLIAEYEHRLLMDERAA